jgi:hypothetical protein
MGVGGSYWFSVEREIRCIHGSSWRFAGFVVVAEGTVVPLSTHFKNLLQIYPVLICVLRTINVATQTRRANIYSVCARVLSKRVIYVLVEDGAPCINAEINSKVF